MSVATTVSQQANADGFYTTTALAYSSPIVQELLYQIETALSGGSVVLAPANGAPSLGLASSKTVAGAHTVFSVFGFNSNANPQFILLFDAAALPANGTVTAFALLAGGQQQFSWDFGPRGLTFSNGISVCNSSTAPSKTIGAADCTFIIQYL